MRHGLYVNMNESSIMLPDNIIYVNVFINYDETLQENPKT